MCPFYNLPKYCIINVHHLNVIKYICSESGTIWVLILRYSSLCSSLGTHVLVHLVHIDAEDEKIE